MKFLTMFARPLSPITGNAREPSKSSIFVVFSFSRWSVLPVADSLLFFLFRAGRYDSAVRHCENCRGFLEMKEEGPVRITKGQFQAIVECRATETPSAETEGKAAIALTRLLEPIFKNKD